MEEDQEAEKHHLVDIVVTEPDASIVYSGITAPAAASETSNEDGNDVSARPDDKDNFVSFNKYTGDIEDKEKGHLFYFDDGLRRIDYILVWKTNNHEKSDEEAAMTRRIFINNLILEGLETEEDIEEGRSKQFTKIHAPFDLLVRYADQMKIRMPIKEKPELNTSVWSQMTGCLARTFSPFQLNKVPNIPKRFTCVFEKDKSYLFEPQIRDHNKFFSRATRSRIVDYILRRKEYTEDHNSLYRYGIERLIADNIYIAAYPLHEGSWKPHSKMSFRKLLHENWASGSVFYKNQPLQFIRLYFGEKIGFYFAWLGYYTAFLVPASIVGLLVFIYGAYTIQDDSISKESCNPHNNYTMCPKCNRRCGYWDYNSICLHIRATHMFDNGATVFFAIFMSLWGTLFLEFWKRKQAGIQFLWDLRNFEKEEVGFFLLLLFLVVLVLQFESSANKNVFKKIFKSNQQEPPRPEYLVRLSEAKYKRPNPLTKEIEPFYPFWRRQVPVFMMSFSVLLFMLLVALAAIVGIIFYRISLLAVLYAFDQAWIYKHAQIFVTATAGFINLLIIFLLNFLYTKLSKILTDWECLRTQTEYDNSLRFKLFVLQCINFYSTLFYIAFFKGRFNGTPAKYETFFGARQEVCEGGSCLTELCIQLAIIFVGKQLIKDNLVEVFLPRLKRRIRLYCNKEQVRRREQLKPWEKDFYLEEMGPLGLLKEYLEMMIQFGFVTLFVAAFPLAPFFALLNNLIEIRADANKFITQYRRSMAARAETIGVWYDILHGVTRLAIVTNAVIIAFTSSFIQREMYRFVYSPSGTMDGYVNNSLAYFNVSEFPTDAKPDPSEIKPKYLQLEYCRYPDYREPPWSNNKYKYSSQHWHVVAAQFIFVVIFENVVILITSIVAYIIPDIPRKLRDQMHQEAIVTNNIILDAELQRARGRDVNNTIEHIRRRAFNSSGNLIRNTESKDPKDDETLL